SRRLRSSLSFVSPTARCTRSLNSAVFARSWSSESAFTDDSSALISWTMGVIDLRKRWLLLPKSLVRNLSKLISDRLLQKSLSNFSFYDCFTQRRKGSKDAPLLTLRLRVKHVSSTPGSSCFLIISTTLCRG